MFSLPRFSTDYKDLQLCFELKVTPLDPTLINMTAENLKKLHKLLMKTARQTLGHYGFKQNISTILNKCGWSTISHMILNASITLLHKILINKEPQVIYSMFSIKTNNINYNLRAKTLNPTTTTYSLLYIPKTKILYSAFITKQLNYTTDYLKIY